MPVRGRAWSDDERMVVLAFYVRTPFSRIDHRHPEVAEIARTLGRSVNSVAMKALNFASLDPALRASGRTGLEGTSVADRKFWERATADWSEMASRASDLEQSLGIKLSPTEEWTGAETERFNTANQRLAQSFFRRVVLTAYGNRCALSGLAVPALLSASHIIPWSVSESDRANPRNGVALNALYDRAFDRGLMSFDQNIRVMVSPQLKVQNADEFHQTWLIAIEGQQAFRPERFAPDPRALEYHRDVVFQH